MSVGGSVFFAFFDRKHDSVQAIKQPSEHIWAPPVTESIISRSINALASAFSSLFVIYILFYLLATDLYIPHSTYKSTTLERKRVLALELEVLAGEKLEVQLCLFYYQSYMMIYT